MSTPTLKRHDNGRIYIHWTEGRRSCRMSTGTDEMADAKKALGNWLLMERSERTGETLDAKITVSEVWSFYMDRAKLAHAARYVSLGRHLGLGLGSQPVCRLKQDHVDRYVRDRTAGRVGRPAAMSTIWLELNTLMTAINFAVRKKLMAVTDKPDIEIPTAPDPRDRWLREDEAARVFLAVEKARRGERLSRVERFLWLALETAARKRVIETLTWDQVDFGSKVIHYHRSGDARTKKRRPSVPISARLLPVLTRAYAERVNDLVLDTSKPINDALTRAAAASGVEGLTPHVMRHTAATWMARRGVPLWLVAGVLGNTLAMTEKVYAKHCPEGLAEAVDQISGFGQLARKPSDAPNSSKFHQTDLSDADISFAPEDV